MKKEKLDSGASRFLPYYLKSHLTWHLTALLYIHRLVSTKHSTHSAPTTMLVQLLAITMASTLADAQQLYNPNVAYTMNLPATAGIFKGLAGFSVGCSGPTPSSCALNASFNSSMAATPFIWVDAVISNLTVKGSYTTSSSPGPGVTIHSFNSGLGVNYTGPAGDGDTIAQIDTGGSWAVSSYGIGPNKGGSGDEELSITNADLTYGLMIDGT